MRPELFPFAEEFLLPRLCAEMPLLPEAPVPALTRLFLRDDSVFLPVRLPLPEEERLPERDDAFLLPAVFFLALFPVDDAIRCYTPFPALLSAV